MQKGLWKSIKNLDKKRPKLKELAKIYIQCAEYIDRIQKENELSNSALSIEDLRRLADKFKLEGSNSKACRVI